MKTLSVVIPARDSQNTIRTTIETLFRQTRKPDEVIVVIDENDQTTTSITDYIKRGFVKIVRTTIPQEYVRDAQWKRYVGINISNGDIIFLTDSKVYLEEDTLEKALTLMEENSVSVVAGITPGWPDQKKNFWSSLHDNGIISNLPKFRELDFLTKENFGATESLPVTCALALEREVFEKIKRDFALNFSKLASTYDDYVLSWLIVDAGYTILLSNKVIARHKHRVQFPDYFAQIGRSGQSAAIMQKLYPECPFANRRHLQVIGIFSLLTISFVYIPLLAVMFGWIFVLVFVYICMGTYLLLGFINVLLAKELRAIFFPFFTIILILNFSLHYIKSYIAENTPENVSKYLQIH